MLFQCREGGELRVRQLGLQTLRDSFRAHPTR
jgi:hypothetical protein